MPIVAVGFNRPATETNCPNQLELHGPTMAVWIGFDPNFNPAQYQHPTLPQTHKDALIDSGASHNSIDYDLAKQLNLPIIDKKPVSGIHGSGEVEICSAQIFLPHFEFTVYGAFALVQLRAGGQNHDALLGRNLLRHFTFYYDGIEGYARLSR